MCSSDLRDRLIQQRSSHSQHSESMRTELENKYVESEHRRQNLEVDLKLADAERTRLRQEVDRLSQELNQERLTVSRLQQEIDQERLRSAGSMAGSPSRTPDLRGDGDARLREAQNRCRQLEDEAEDLKMRLDRQGQLADAADDVVGLHADAQRLREQLAASERQRHELEDRLSDLQQSIGSARDGQRDLDAADVSACKLCTERNLRIRTLLKEKAECHAQVRQLSSEVVGLTEALEMVTKRAQEKDHRHTELQDRKSVV